MAAIASRTGGDTRKTSTNGSLFAKGTDMAADRVSSPTPPEPTPYYADAHVTIYHADALEILPTFERHQFDLGFADPPYNYGVAYDGYDDSLPGPQYAEWCWSWFQLLRRASWNVIVTPGHGNLPIWLGAGLLGNLDQPSSIGCWYKPGGTGSSHLGWCEWEPWLYWGRRLGGSDVLKATLNPTFKSDVGHPCPKPVELLKKLLVKAKAQTVLDPFMGSGTTLVAAKELGLSGVGIEQSERYCEVAAKRCAQGALDFAAVAP